MQWFGMMLVVLVLQSVEAAVPDQSLEIEKKDKILSVEQAVWDDPGNRYSQFFVKAGAFHVLASDFDGDGKVDLAFTSHSGNQIQVFRQVSPRRFKATEPQDIVGFHPNAAITLPGVPKRYLVNAEGEGKILILAANSHGRFTVIAERAEPGPLASTAFVWPGWGHIALAVVPYSGSSLVLLKGFDPETASVKASISISTDNDPRPSRLADLDRDGIPELVFPTFWNSKIWAVEYKSSDQDPTVRELASLKNGWPRHVVPIDLNHDGAVDLLVPLSVQERIVVLQNDGKGYFKEGPSIPYPGRVGIHAFNIGQDRGGRYLLAGGSRALVLYRERQEAPGSFENIILPLMNWPNHIELVDVDGDNWLDAVVADQGQSGSRVIYGPLWDSFGKLADLPKNTRKD